MNKTFSLSALILGLFGAFALADVPADGEALEYAGVFEGAAAGSPVSVALYDNGTAGAGTLLCGPVSATVVGTRFKAVLPASCAKAIRENPAVFIQVSVSGVAVERVRMRAQAYALDAKRVVLSSDAGVRTTVDGMFCGATAPTTGRFLGPGSTTGYRAAKVLCEAACRQSTAHMCSTLEVITSVELGITPPAGWMKAGVASPGSVGATGVVMSECNAWSIDTKNNGGNFYGAPYWDMTIATFDWCGTPSSPHAILCCD